MSASPEHNHEHAERHERIHEQLSDERESRLEALRSAEHTEANSAAERANEARKLIHKEEQQPEPEPVAQGEKSTAKSHLPFLDHKLNYADTMASVQRRLGPASRSFSKVIHTPVVEKTSEALERTVARPSVTAGATFTALIVGSLFYFTARHYGYQLSGSEMLFSFIVGALLGLLIEGIWRALRGRHA